MAPDLQNLNVYSVPVRTLLFDADFSWNILGTVQREKRSIHPKCKGFRWCPSQDLPLISFSDQRRPTQNLLGFPWRWTLVSAPSAASAAATNRGVCRDHQEQRQFLLIPQIPWGYALLVPALSLHHYPIAFCPGAFVSQLSHGRTNVLISSVEQPRTARVNAPFGHPWLVGHGCWWTNTFFQMDSLEKQKL